MYNELDWEDIESRLYSQVYHASAENEGYVAPTSSNTNEDDAIRLQSRFKVRNITSKSTRQNNRYFDREKDVHSNSPMYISLEQNTNITTPDSTCNPIQSNICSGSSEGESSSSVKFVGQFQNNIPVNQCSVPVIINSELDERDDATNKRLLSANSYNNSYQRFLEKKQKRRWKRKQEKKDKKRKNILVEKFGKLMQSLMVGMDDKGISDNSENMVNNDVICVSDESTSECIIVQDTEPLEITVTEHIATGFPKKYDDNENSKKPESDDDIIYIPPPPVEVINIDVDESRGKEQEETTVVEEEQQGNRIEGGELKETESRQLELHETSDPSSKTLNSKEPKELSCTLELSGSNDFLENASIEINTNKFNFGLHGSDFNSASGDFVRPTNPVEFCETESSCSTNDLNRDSMQFTNSVKTIVFNEVDFPKADIFSENNLESFGTYITPKRSAKGSSETSKNSENPPANKTSSTSTDSSSESDFEPSDRLKTMKEMKKLPNLSPMQFTEATVSNKKSKKKNASEFKDTKKDTPKRKLDVTSETDSDKSVEKPVDTKKKQSKKKHKMADAEETSVMGKKKKGNSSDIPSESDKKKKPKNADYTLDKAQNKKKKDLSETIDSDSDQSDAETNSQRKKKKSCTESKNSDNEKKKKKHSSENDHKEVTTKKKKKKNSESAQLPEPEDLNEVSAVVDKVKKKKSVSSENEDSCVEKKAKKRRKSCSISSNKSLEVSEVEEYIEVELSDEVNREAVEFNKSDVENLELYELPEQKDSSLRENMVVEAKENVFDNEQHTIHHDNNDDKAYGESMATITGISCDGNAEEHDSDEEIIVDDDVASNLSSLIVVDDVDEPFIEVLLSSDSENVTKAGIKENLSLANCTASNAEQIKVSEEPMVVTSTESSTSSHVIQRCSREFDVEAIQRTQTDDPEAWQISYKDRYTHLNERPRGPRCARCRQIGHMAVRCTEKQGPPKCTLCGSPGHQEPRCKKKMCLQCGNEGDYSMSYCWKCFKFRNSICRICNMRGHIAKTCPDLWRRYHLTTEEGPIVVPRYPQSRAGSQQWCAGCAQQGHLEHECNYIHRHHPPTNPYVISYEDVLVKENPRDLLDDDDVSAHLEVTPNSPEIILIEDVEEDAKNEDSSAVLNVPSQDVNSSSNAVSASQHITSSKDEVANSTAVSFEPNPSNDVPVVSLISSSESSQESSSDSSASDVEESRVKSVKYPNRSNEVEIFEKSSLEQFRVLEIGKNFISMCSMYNIKFVNISERADMSTRTAIMTRYLVKEHRLRIKRMLLKQPERFREYLETDMVEMQSLGNISNLSFFRQIIVKYNKPRRRTGMVVTKEILYQHCFWFRILNMFVFGLHGYGEGKAHLGILRKFLDKETNEKPTDKDLLKSHGYIFGIEKHRGVNYYRLINKIIKQYKM